MDILRCYKILELDHDASMGEAREAYIDMARVWHPDRFTDNPKLRKRAEEKLKEINIAYGEISVLLSTGSSLQKQKPGTGSQGALGAICKKIISNLYSYAHSMLKKAQVKQKFRQIFFPKIEPGDDTSRRQTQKSNKPSNGAERMDKGRTTHKNFADIYEELAKAKREEKRKMGEVR